MINIFANARTHRVHGRPVGWVYQHTFDERPKPTHARLNLVDGANSVPKDTIARLGGFDNRTSSGPLAVIREKGL